MNRLTRFGLTFLFSWGLNACGTTASSEDVAVAPEPEVVEPVEETAVPKRLKKRLKNRMSKSSPTWMKTLLTKTAEESVDEVQAEEVPAERARC